MSARSTTAIAAVLFAAARKAGAFLVRLIHNQPASDFESQLFASANALMESIMNRIFRRTFQPTLPAALKAVH